MHIFIKKKYDTVGAQKRVSNVSLKDYSAKLIKIIFFKK